MANLLILSNNYLSGDNEAIGGLYAALKPRLLLIAYNYCRDKEVSQDIVQDVFEKMLRVPVYRRKEYFENAISNIEGYLAVIVKNKCLDVIKTNKNRGNIIRSLGHLFIEITDTDFESRFLQDGLKEMLGCLQPRERHIILLHFDGHTNEEIADSLNITYNTVKNNIYEAKKKLKKIWNVFMN